jgi:hypothetical protein
LSEWLPLLNTVILAFLTAALAYITGKSTSATHRLHELEDKLREDRVSVYNEIVESYLILFIPLSAWQSDPKNIGKDKSEVAQQRLMSLQYRKTVFKMSLIGADKVINAYNSLMKSFHPTPPTESDFADKLGTLLLEIRKSMGNETTSLSNWDVLSCLLPAEEANKYRPLSK